MSEYSDYVAERRSRKPPELPAGMYKLKILNAVHEQDKTRVRLAIEIVDGAYAGFFRNLLDYIDNWRGYVQQPYAGKAKYYYDKLIQTIQASNPAADLSGNINDIDDVIVRLKGMQFRVYLDPFVYKRVNSRDYIRYNMVFKKGR